MASYDHQIPPGGLGKITLKVKIHQGHFTKAARVKTNDPKLPHFVLRLSGEIIPFIKVSSPRIRLRGFCSDTLSKTVKLEALDGSMFNISKVESTLPEFKWSVNPQKDSKNYQFKFQIKSDVPKNVRGKITIFTDHPHKNSLVIYVYAYFRPRVKLKPKQVYWKDFKQEPLQRTVYLVIKKPDKNIQIKKLIYPEKLFEVSWQKVKAKRIYEIKLLPKVKQFSLGSFNYRLRVITDPPLPYPLEVTLVGTVNP